MVVTTGPVYVPAPNPIIRRYGLFDVVTGPLDLPINARSGGLQYELGTCTLPNAYEVNCQDDLDTKTFDGSIETQVGYPFVIYSGITCSPIGLANSGQERIRKYLYEQLTAGEQATVENVFSTSGSGQTLGLANNPNVVNLGTAPDIVNGFGLLEEWLYARYGLQGVIHVPMKAAAMVASQHLPYAEYGVPCSTIVKSKLSFGNYAGLGPTGQAAAAGSVWLYITGAMAIWRTPDSQLLDIPIGQVINRSTNEVEIVMEREYVVTYDCYVAAIEAVNAPPATAS